VGGHPPARLRLTVALLAVLPLAACRGERGAATASAGVAGTTGPAGLAQVERVIDGDTIDVSIDGREERVRMIGIDTPETKIPDQPPECWGPEAAALTEQLLPAGTTVRLERDLEPRDDYGRLLAYVIRQADELVVNVELARQGAAEPLRIRPNLAMSVPISAAAAEARAAGRGRWGACSR
jgi:micrococcal nuclease